MRVQAVKNTKNLFKLIYPKSLSGVNGTKISKKELTSASIYIGHLLKEPAFSISQTLQGASLEKVRFLKNLAKKYSMRNADLPVEMHESKEELFQIYNAINKPLPAHFDILRRTPDGFDTLKTIFSLARDEKSLEFVSSLQRGALREKANQSNVIIDMLNSKHKYMFMEDIGQYKSYFELFSGDTKAVEKLDLSIDKKHYDRKKYDSRFEIKKLMQHKIVNDYAKVYEKTLTRYYTKESGKFLERLTNRLFYSRTEAGSVDKKEFLDLYKSTNAENLNLRLAVLNNFRNNFKQKEKFDLHELIKLFKNIEKNKDIKQFVTYSVERGLAVNSVKELNMIIENVQTKKANYFFDNLRRIVALSDGEERKWALANELENPFYKPLHKRTNGNGNIRDNVFDYGFLVKLQKYIQNKVKKFVFNKFVAKTELSAESIDKPSPAFKIKKMKHNSRIELAKEVKEYVKNKLGSRIYDMQEDTYRLKATRIRLNLLPDIFESVKAVRAQERAKGLKPVVSNKDASSLYELISGTNRKIVRYMLKKCGDNGNRIFNVREIISLIEDSNKKVSAAKKSNPGYRAADTKVYYENLYTDLISKYGNLKRTAKVPTKNH